MKGKTIGYLLSVMFIVSLNLPLCGCSPENSENTEVPTNGTKIVMTVGEEQFAATLADNQTAQAFAEMLPMTLDLREMNGNEKYFYLDESLPADPYRPGTIEAGDLMLYGSSCVVLFYETFSSGYSYTRIGKAEHAEALAAALGEGNVTVTFSLDENEKE